MVNTDKTTVHKIAIFPLGMINAFLLINSQGCILIDTGLPNLHIADQNDHPLRSKVITSCS